MKALCRDLLGYCGSSSGSRRSGRRESERAFGFPFLLCLAAGLGLLPVSVGASTAGEGRVAFSSSPVGDQVLSESSGIRDVAVPIEEMSESHFRQSDIKGLHGTQGGEDPELPYFERAIALENKKEWRQLLDLSRKWTSAYPNEAASWFFLGLSYEKLNQYHEAIRAYREAIQKKREFAKAWCNLGTCYAYLGQYSEAVDALKTAVAQKEDFGRAWSDLGAAYVELGRHQEAVTALEKATQLRSDLPEAWGNLGCAYAELKKYDAAIAATRKAVHLKPDYGAAWYNLATLYKATGQKEKMVEASQKVGEIDPAMGKELAQKLVAPAP